MKRLALRIPMVAAMLASVGAVCAQSYPAKPIRIVTSGIGNAFDMTARQIAQLISGPLGQPVIIDNRPPGVIPGQVVMQSAPDGYTLLYAGASLWLGPFMQSVPYDVVRDFQPITLTTRSPTLLVVHPSLPVSSVSDLIALARSRPGALNYASATNGAISHLTPELFKSIAKVDIVRVAYRGAAPALTDLMAGQVQIMFTVTGSVAPHLKSGRLKVLAVTTLQPTVLAPGVPTVAATGLPGFESVSTAGILGPAKLPPVILDRLNQEIAKALHRPEVRDQFLGNGVEAVGNTPAEFDASIKSEMAKMGKVIRDANIRGE